MNTEIKVAEQRNWTDNIKRVLTIKRDQFNNTYSQDEASNLDYVKDNITYHRDALASISEYDLRHADIAMIRSIKKQIEDYRDWVSTYTALQVHELDKPVYGIVFDTVDIGFIRIIEDIAEKYKVTSQRFGLHTQPVKPGFVEGICIDVRELSLDTSVDSRLNQLISEVQLALNGIHPTLPFSFRPIYWDEDLLVEVQPFKKA